ncbi:MAG: 3-isopropylmalate dehydratase small subunit [Clostridia bacterium]|nr:3-isopropylmalate dehydratase small subunit [Clostridia bacterium]
MKVTSKVIKYGDHVDTDVIIPARYLNTADPAELAAHCMEDLDTDFKKKAETASIVVAGRNFGCGSSREHAPVAIKASGIQLVIADSFARIFYRNSIDIGLPIVECPAAAAAIGDGDEVEADLDQGIITDLTTGEKFETVPFPAFIEEIIACGGIGEFVRSKIGGKKA